MWIRVCLALIGLIVSGEVLKAAEVTARITDAMGAGVPVDAELSGVTVQSQRSLETGELRFDGVPSGKYVLWLKCPGFQTKVLRVSVPQTGELDLGRLQLDVVSREFEVALPRESGQAGATLSIAIEPKQARWTLRCTTRKLCGRDTLRGSGNVDLHQLRPGRYELRVEAKLHFPRGSEVELADGFAYKFQIGLMECLDPRCKKNVLYL